MEVYEEVPFDNGPLVDTRWFLSDKSGVSKARLNSKGYQDETVPRQAVEEDSPMCTWDSKGMVTAIVVGRG